MYRIIKNKKIRKSIAILLLLNLLSLDIIYAADIVVGSGDTTVDKTANGIDLINISNPNDRGISHNDFDKYNVDERGVVINNSTEVGRSELAGIVNNNPNLTNSASIIIAEVSGSEKSNLNGYTEIFGGSADFILANPNGIYVNGAGFINTPRVTLTTGEIGDTNETLNLLINKGNVTVGEKGLDLSSVNYFEIISRIAKLNGSIYAKGDVRLITGLNEYNYNTKEYQKINGVTNDKPEIGIDSTALGGIYAGRITLIGTEEGVGVNSNSKLVADISDVIIDVDGNIKLKDVSSQNNIVINGKNIENNGKIIAEKNISIIGDSLNNFNYIIGKNENRLDLDSLNNKGTIYGLELTAIIKNDFQNSGNLVGKNSTNVSSENLKNTGNIQSYGDIEINLENKLENKGNIISSKSQETTDKKSSIKIKAKEIKNQNNEEGIGLIFSSEEIKLTSDNLVNEGEIKSNGEISITLTDNLTNIGDIISISSENSNKEASIIIKAKGIVNNTDNEKIGRIFGHDLIELESEDFLNKGNILSNNRVNISTQNNLQNESIIFSKDIFLITLDKIINKGKIQSENGNLTIESKNIDNTEGELLSNKEISLKLIENAEISGVIFGEEKVSIEGNDLNINTEINSGEVGIRGENITINNAILGLNKVDINGKSIINNNRVESLNQIYLNSLLSFINNGQVASNNFLEIKSGSITNNSVLFATNNLFIKSDGNIVNKDFIKSLGNIYIQGNTNENAILLRNEAGKIHAKEDIQIKSNEIENIGVVYGQVEKREVVVNQLEREYDDRFEFALSEGTDVLYEKIHKKIVGDNSNFRVLQAEIKGGNISVSGDNFLNYGSLVNSRENISITLSGVLRNETPIYSEFLSNYQTMVTRTKETDVKWGMILLGIPPLSTVKYRNNLSNNSGTLVVETVEKAQITAGNNISINANQVGNGQQLNNQEVEVTINKVEVDSSFNNKPSGSVSIPEDIQLPEGDFGMFVTNENLENREDAGFTYLVETNVNFIDLDKYYGSTYFFEQINYNPEKDININLLGDSYYETQLVSNLLSKEIGQNYLFEGIYDEAEQMKKLYDNAVIVSTDMNLTVGVALTKEQIENLKEDIIWLVEKEINGHKVLAPEIYLSKTTLENIELNGTSIKAKENLVVKAKTVDNSGKLSASYIGIQAKDINNITNGYTQAEISGDIVTLIAENNIINSGAKISGEKEINIKAGGDVIFDTIANVTESGSGNNYSKEVTHTLSEVSGGDITIISEGGDVKLIGTQMNASGNVGIQAENDVLLLAVKDSKLEKTETTESGFLKSKTTTTEKYDETIHGSSINADGNIIISAGNNVGLVGSTIGINEVNFQTEDGEEVSAKLGGVSISAGNDVYAIEEREKDYSITKTEEKGFTVDWDKDSTTLKVGVENNKKTEYNITDKGSGSSIAGRDVVIDANGKVILEGSDIKADNVAKVTGTKGIDIIETKDITINEVKEESEFAGLTVSVNSDILKVGDHLDKIKEVGEGLKGDKSDIINSISKAMDGVRGTADAINEAPDYSGKGVTNNETNNMKLDYDYKSQVSASIGAEKTESNSSSYNEKVKGSSIQGGTVELSSEGEILVRGSNISGKDISIDADKFTVKAAEENSNSQSRSENQNISLGVSEKGIGDLTIGGGRDKSNSSSTKNINSTVNASGNLTINTKGDMVVSGGNVKADTVDMNIGGNLTVESLQDKEVSESDSKSGSLTAGMSGNVSGSFNTREDESNKAWVNNQSSIIAQNGGSIKVGNNTQLKGAVIASESSENKLALDTKTISTEDISDDEEGESKGFGVSGGVGSVPSTSIVYGNKDKEQINKATISGVDLTVDGEETSTEELGINSDLAKAQEVTKDEELKTIDANLHTDLANQEERDKLVDAGDKLNDVGNAIIDSGDGKGFSNTLKNNRFTTNGTRAVERDEELTKALNSLEGLSPEAQRDILQKVIDTYYEANGYDQQIAPKVTLYDGNSEEGFHDENNTDRVNEVFINVNTINEMLSGGGGVADVIAVAVHETTHINQMSDKNEREEADKNGINTSEENLAEHVEGRIEDKLDLDEDTFTEEELNDYLAELKKENEEKGREQKDLAQGTEDANEVADEDKEKSSFMTHEEFKKNLEFYNTGLENINPEIFNKSKLKVTEENVALISSMLAEYGEQLIASGNPFGVAGGVVLTLPEQVLDIKDIADALTNGEFRKAAELLTPLVIIGLDSHLSKKVIKANYEGTLELEYNGKETLKIEFDSDAGANNVTLYKHVDSKTDELIDTTLTTDKTGKYLEGKIDEKIKNGEYSDTVETIKESEFPDRESAKEVANQLEGKEAKVPTNKPEDTYVTQIKEDIKKAETVDDYIKIGQQIEKDNVRKDGAMGTPVGDIAEGIAEVKAKERLKENEEIIDMKVKGNKGLDRVVVERDPDTKEITKVTYYEVKQEGGYPSDTANKERQGSKVYGEMSMDEVKRYGEESQKKDIDEMKEAISEGRYESKLERVNIKTGEVEVYDLDEDGIIIDNTKKVY